MKETLINVYYYVRFMLHKAKQKFTSRLRTLRYQLFHKTTREIEISKCGLCNRQWNTTILKDEEGLPIYFGDPINPFCLKCAQSGRSEERRVGKSVDLGGGRIIKKKNNN